MNEEQLERHLGHCTDTLDRQLLLGQLTQAEYDDKIRRLDEWVERYRTLFAYAIDERARQRRQDSAEAGMSGADDTRM